ncbi:MAG: hypothetical protein P1V18_05420 [Candidatus Gracilibacteria bacterium]|nr:hypothetical protein [Candidatus Gracilibacteria bacterium]
MKRLDENAETPDDVIRYLKSRSIQMLRFGAVLHQIEVREKIFVALFSKGNEEFQTVYIPVKERGKSAYVAEFEKRNLSVLTSKECQLVKFLEVKKIPHISFEIEDCQEYRMIQEYYGDYIAKRSGAYLMDHIDEGRALLQWIGASDTAHRAYCLHPLLQSDNDLSDNFKRDWTEVNPQALLAAMEYRAIANDYLSQRSILSLDEVKLSVLKDVNDMLIADKVQNRKDFEKYHKGKHTRSNELEIYFKNWLEILKVSEDQYQHFVEKLSVEPKIVYL